MKVEIKGWIYRYQESWMNQPAFQFLQLDYVDSSFAKICEHVIEIELPDGDYIQERVAAVRGEKAKVTSELGEKLRKLAQKEEELLALEFKSGTGTQD